MKAQIKGKVTFTHSHSCKLTNWWMESRHLTGHPSMASKYSSNPARSRHPGLSPTPLDRGLKVHLQTRSITASKWLSRLTPVRPASANDHGLLVHLRTRSITILECISKFTPSRPPSESPSPPDHSLQVLLHTHLTMASKCINKQARSHPTSLSPNPLDHSLQVYLQTHSITASKFT